MPNVKRMDYAGEHKKQPVTGPKPSTGGGSVSWANDSKTRGNKSTGRTFGKKAESTFNGMTKLGSLKRG